jgi:hypothetical protein
MEETEYTRSAQTQTLTLTLIGKSKDQQLYQWTHVGTQVVTNVTSHDIQQIFHSMTFFIK